MPRNAVHTVPWEGRWRNKREGERPAPKSFRRQTDAIAAGREMAKASKSEHFIHRRNGTIRARNSYGRDPFPSRG